LIDNCDSSVTVSPDSKQLAFVRGSWPGDTAIVVADVGGERQHTINQHSRDIYYSSVSWSPDGKTLAASVFVFDGSYVVSMPVAGGKEKSLTKKEWNQIHDLAWISSKVLMVSGSPKYENSSYKLWQISYPSGELRQVTGDLSTYTGVSASIGSRVLTATRSEMLCNLFVATDGQNNSYRQITVGPGRNDGMFGIAWTPDGKLVYDSLASGSWDLWITATDGSSVQQLTRDSTFNGFPRVSKDGRWMVFASNRNGSVHVWRMAIDGGDVQQLTYRLGNVPDISPDGSWFAYTDFSKGGRPTLWRKSIQTDDAAQVARDALISAISPDGKTIALLLNLPTSYVLDEMKLNLIRADDGAPIKVISLSAHYPTGLCIRWTPDGRALLFIQDQRGISNIWKQPLEGGPATPFTHFKAGTIFYFDVARDGRFALARGTVSSDAVLIRESR
jgi:Tol biopolymer transport system component